MDSERFHEFFFYSTDDLDKVSVELTPGGGMIFVFWREKISLFALKRYRFNDEHLPCNNRSVLSAKPVVWSAYSNNENEDEIVNHVCHAGDVRVSRNTVRSQTRDGVERGENPRSPSRRRVEKPKL